MRELIVAADGVEESKLLCRYCRFAEQRIPVDIAGPRVGAIMRKHGYALSWSCRGQGPQAVRLDERPVSTTRQILESGEPVAAICRRAQVLISGHVLDGRKGTRYKGPETISRQRAVTTWPRR